MSERRIGTAGWAIPKPAADRFPPEGAGLSRYATRLNCVEINTSFYRPHRVSTWAGWAERTPADFRFSAKLPKAITHTARFVDCNAVLAAFANEIAALGDKLAVVLVQLPPSFAFDAPLLDAFLPQLRAAVSCDLALEPRHVSWFEPEADALLARHRVARVAADPALVPAAASPGGWRGLTYVRLHGSPRTYFSAYDEAFVAGIAAQVEADPAPAWCIFDNTGGSAAAGNALDLREMLG